MRGALCAAAWLALGAPAAAEPAAWAGRLDAAVAEASAASGLPPAWIRAVMARESGGDRFAVSRAGALGLMQLMPGTWRKMRARLGLGADPFDVRDNVLAGGAYLREMLERFGPEGFLAAYNAGPGRYAEFRAGRAVLPPETRAYVADLGPRIGLAAAPARALPRAPLAPVASGLFPLDAGGSR